MIYFSFSLYGANPKYTHGMLANAALIQEYYPEARTIVYIASDVPIVIRNALSSFPNVVLRDVMARSGRAGSFDRFLAIDEPECDIMIVRDADSRIHARDRACIDDFLARPDKTLHIIRDHFNHEYYVLAGMYAIRKEFMNGKTMVSLIEEWSKSNTMSRFLDDQDFLARYIYKNTDALVHDRFGRFEDPATHAPFRVPIENNLFVGQVHLFHMDGTEYTMYNA